MVGRNQYFGNLNLPKSLKVKVKVARHELYNNTLYYVVNEIDDKFVL